MKFITDDVARDYARKVAAMREKQKEFFDQSRRRPSTVGEAKTLEREVDKLTGALLDDRPGLFDDEERGGS